MTVIIPTFNRSAKIAGVLQALDDQIAQDFRYVVRVMDDGSTDDTAQVLSQFRPNNYEFHWQKQANTGQGGARNKLLAETDTELVVIIGDDITPSPRFLEFHRNAHLASNDTKLSVLGLTSWDKRAPVNTVMAHIDGIGAQQFSYFYLKDGEYYDYRHFYTSNISTRTAFIRSLGEIFRHNFKGYGFEDIEVGLRLEKMGGRILLNRNAIAFHDHFYSVRGFCRRQFNVGLAAQTFIDLHPEVRNVLGVKKLDSILRKTLLPSTRSANRHFIANVESIEKLEETAFRLLETYESVHLNSLDAVYIAIFTYFYYKGLAEVRKSWLISETRIALAREMLLPAIENFLRLLEDEAVPVPPEEKVRLANFHKAGLASIHK